MKKYIASSVCMAAFPIKCPKDGCTGKIKSSQANFFIDKKLQLRLSEVMAKKIRSEDKDLMQEYVVESEILHWHPALRISQYYWYEPDFPLDANGLSPKDRGEGHYKIGKNMLYCLECRMAFCPKCKLPHDQHTSCAKYANEQNRKAHLENMQCIAKVDNVTALA